MRVCVRWGAIALLTIVVSLVSPISAHEPDSPLVKAAIEKGLAYLDVNTHTRMGGKALMGLTMVKAGRDREDPVIKAGVEAVKRACANGPDNQNDGIYDTGIAIMFLVALDPSEFNAEIDCMVKSLHRRQKKEGAWGYPEGHQHGESCDTSMTQYAVLGLWEAQEQAGVPTPPEVWDRCAEWLIRTQDLSGGYGYQGIVSEDLNQRVKQKQIKHSMGVAAGTCIYIARHMLGFTDLLKPAEDDTPPQLRIFEDEAARKNRIVSQLDGRLLDRCVLGLNRWMQREYSITPGGGSWQHYYMYGLERYEALKLAERFGAAAVNDTRTPLWYHQGSNYLLANQNDDGSWKGQAGEVPDTCFSLLFLLRSTKKSLEKTGQRYQSGLLIAGRGLPGTRGEVRLRDGRVVVTPDGTLAQALSVLSDPKAAGNVETLSIAREVLADAAHAGDASTLASQSQTLAHLAAHSQGEVQRLAIAALASSGNLDHAPLLIRLLSSEDTQLMLAARDALRTLSRRYDGFGMTVDSLPEERAEVIAKWRDWLASVRPELDQAGYEAPSTP
jgi:hypothetical protein